MRLGIERRVLKCSRVRVGGRNVWGAVVQTAERANAEMCEDIRRTRSLQNWYIPLVGIEPCTY